MTDHSDEPQPPAPSKGISRRTLLVGGSVGVVVVGGAVAAGISFSRGTPPLAVAKTMIVNGAVWTGDLTRTAEAVAIGRDGVILGVGSNEDIGRFKGAGTEIIDAEGGTVMPGIHDAHQHPLSGAEGAAYPSLGDESVTVAELQERLRGFLASTPDMEPDGWLVVVDWNPAGLTDAIAHRDFLDVLETNRPIFLAGSDFHNGWANSAALAAAGVTSTTPDPEGGVIVRDANGPTGLLKDAALWAVRGAAPELTDKQKQDAYRAGFQLAASLGITSFMDAAGGRESVETFQDLRGRGIVHQRVSVAQTIDADTATDPEGALAQIEDARAAVIKDSGVSVRTAKVFLDGVAEFPAQTAAMLDPYLDGDGSPTDHYGEQYVSTDDFTKLATTLDAAGWQIHTHSIGDAAVRTSLDGFQAARKNNGKRDNRHTITHIQFCTESDYPRFAELEVIANMQLQWATPSAFTLDSLQPYIAPHSYARQYPAGALHRAGARLSGGSDWPVDRLNPWNQVRTAVDRTGSTSETGGPLNASESIDLATSLTMHTEGAAYQLFQDGLTGRIEPGLAADIVILNHNLLTSPIASVSDTTVNYTLINGKVIHDPSRRQ
ncbi:amidohydrolase [Microbacterium rhizomatis]|uniref:Amidohydrolase n=1 Tax=Microbacterium rhizomatis TaxID=1631477 RepID=A0A5J5IX81_9MICO|nr:amidohydrolase [Microbacterium rhizomatis]KAA9105855.1 amidohydrolase [Microbacterium rhizomatis]